MLGSDDHKLVVVDGVKLFTWRAWCARRRCAIIVETLLLYEEHSKGKTNTKKKMPNEK
jgi:hypothetical protein